MSKIQFRLAARTDAAGKFNATAPLEGNEDNMFVDADLSNDAQGEFMADEIVDLSDKGCLMVVADGMGGMNAGEVASALAIKTVMKFFNPEHLKGKAFRDSRSRMNYMEDVVLAADAAIKADSRSNKSHEGMGSTIIMAWLCDGEICVTWCGDSRAYLFRPGCGFWQVSKDHSYVQGLVDDGKITIDEAFDHPYGNIITRSLGDPEKKSRADSIHFDVYQGDVFMLCSDGLSGVLRDHKTFVDGQRVDTENLEDVIASNRDSMAQCRDELFDAAQRNEWYDNVTAVLCEIVKGEPLPADLKRPAQQVQVSQESYLTPTQNPIQPNSRTNNSHIKIRKKRVPLIIIALILLGALSFLAWKLLKPEQYDLGKDNSMYEKCQTGDDYRAYMKKYPEGIGANYELAKNRLTEWVADSTQIAKNDSLTKLDTGGVPNGKTNLPSQLPAKTEDKQKKNDEPIVQSVSDKEKVEVLSTESDNAIAKETVREKESITPEKADEASDLSEQTETPKIDEQKPKGLTEAGKDQQKKGITKTIVNLTEEQAFSRIKTDGNIDENLSYCYYYIDNWKEGKYKDQVIVLFVKLFRKKLSSCTTVAQVEMFKNEIRDIVLNKMKMEEKWVTGFDEFAKKRIEELKKNDLDNRPKPAGRGI